MSRLDSKSFSAVSVNARQFARLRDVDDDLLIRSEGLATHRKGIKLGSPSGSLGRLTQPSHLRTVVFTRVFFSLSRCCFDDMFCLERPHAPIRREPNSQ